MSLGIIDGVKLWDIEERREVWKTPSPEGRSRGVAFNSAGTRLVSGWSKRLRIWDATTGDLLKELSGHTRLVTCVAFSPDDSRIFSASQDGTIKVWASAGGEELLSLPFPEGGMCWYVAVSPDGKTVAAAHDSGTVTIWPSTSR